MAIAVHQNNIAWGHRRVPNNLIRSRRTIGNEKQVIGIEDPRGIALAGQHWASVVQQLT